MPRLIPVRRPDFIRTMRKLGFVGPLPGTKHQTMMKGERVFAVPNPHRSDIGIDLLRRILNEAGVTVEEWSRALHS